MPSLLQKASACQRFFLHIRWCRRCWSFWKCQSWQAQWDNELYIVFGNRKLKALQDACSRDHSLNSRRLHCFEEAGVQPIRIHKLPMGEVSNKSSEFAPNLANFTPQGVSKRNGTCNLEDGLPPQYWRIWLIETCLGALAMHAAQAGVKIGRLS